MYGSNGLYLSFYIFLSMHPIFSIQKLCLPGYLCFPWEAICSSSLNTSDHATNDTLFTISPNTGYYLRFFFSNAW